MYAPASGVDGAGSFAAAAGSSPSTRRTGMSASGTRSRVAPSVRISAMPASAAMKPSRSAGYWGSRGT
ncbi:hypothetical protein EES42_27810 [Streptomyces sp. ADI95-17]|nr:hypothetical protein EES42_27810 [Streptomyces sp. ADI95-17]